MRAADIIETLVALRPTQEPIILTGPPGVGKSSLVRQAAQQLSIQFMDVRLYLRDITDFTFPVAKAPVNGDDKPQLWWIQSILPNDPAWEGIIFLDELPQAVPMVQNVASNLLLDRNLGDYQLPARAWCIAAGNRSSDRAASHRIPSHVRSRLIFLEMEVSHDDWHAWAAANDVSEEVRGYLRFKPDNLHKFEGAADANSFPCPRSWEKVSKIIKYIPERLLHQVCTGIVGEGPAAEFVAFLHTYRHLPDIDLVLKNPKTVKLPEDAQILYALCAQVINKVRRSKEDLPTLRAVMQLALRLPEELAVFAVRDSALLAPKLINPKFTPEAKDYLVQHKHVLLGDSGGIN